MKKNFLTSFYLLSLIIFFLGITQCKNGLVAVDKIETISIDTTPISRLSHYYKFLVSLKNKGFVFWDFKTFLATDTSNLPKNLIVLRHDIHELDVPWAYPTFKIEQILIGEGHSTFYIMLNDPLELTYNVAIRQGSYLTLLNYLNTYHVDIQPHISPIDMYIMNEHPFWENYSKTRLAKIFADNYKWNISKTGRKIKITGIDVFNLNDINKTLLTLLAKYNAQWTKQTKLNVQGYAAHGSMTNMNAVLNNAYILDQFVLLNAGIYDYDTYNSKIFNILTYLSDNEMPSWMTLPDSIAQGRYQFLMHPHQWSRIH